MNITNDIREQILKQLYHGECLFKDLDIEYRDDFDFVNAHLKQSGSALQFVSPKLKDHEAIVSTAIKNNGLALEYASPRLKKNKALVLQAINQNGFAIQYAHTTLKNDPVIVKTAAYNWPDILEYFKNDITRTKEFVMGLIEANKNNPHVLKYVAKSLRNDKKVILAAINQQGYAFKYASKSLQDNIELASIAVENSSYAFEFVSNRLKNDRSLALLAINGDITNLQYVGNQLKQKKDFILDVVYNHDSYRLLPKQFQHSSEVLYVIKRKCVIKDLEWPILKEALLKNPNVVMNPPDAIRELCNGMEHYYLYIAQYALAQLAPNNTTDLPEISF